MPENLQLVKDRLKTLSAEVAAGGVGHMPAWDEDDVVISPNHPLPSDDHGHYPTNRWVITSFTWELSWLFHRLRDAFGPAVQIRSSYVFFGRLADSANRYLAATDPKKQTARDLLLAVLDEARAMSEEMGR